MSTSGYPAPAFAVIGMSGRFPGATNISDLWSNLRRRRVDHVLHRRGAARRGRSTRAAERSRLRARRHPGGHRPVRRRVLRDEAARRGRLRSAAPPLPRVRLGGVRARRLRRRADRRRRRRVRVVRGQRVHVQERAAPTSTSRRRSASGWCATPATTPTSWPRGSPTSSTCTGRASTCRRRAARRWSPSTWPARACSAASATWRSPAARSSRPCSDRGYLYKEGEILSPDGHCRAVRRQGGRHRHLQRRAAACCSSRWPTRSTTATTCWRSIRGSAINNDGRAKVGYLAPSVAGQAQVVTEALAVAGVDARDVTYVEAHGTGTLIGDPIEIAGADPGVPRDDRRHAVLRHRLAEVEHRPHRRGRRRRRAHQDRAGAAAPRDPAEPALRVAQPAGRLPEQPVLRQRRAARRGSRRPGGTRIAGDHRRSAPAAPTPT